MGKTTFQDLTGDQYGDLRVVSRAPSRGNATYWVCRCVCGLIKELQPSRFHLGIGTKCKHIKSTKRAPTLRSKHPLYGIWSGMKARCEIPSTSGFHYYGGRGIRVCERWHTFALFVADMGERPLGQSIDRIDVNGNYEPSNCRWADHQTQMINRRNRVVINFHGRFKSLQEIAVETRVPYASLAAWYRRKQDIQARAAAYPNRIYERAI